MKGLSSHVETTKLAAELKLPREQFTFLEEYPAASIRQLRDLVSETLYAEHRPLFKLLARLMTLIPLWLAIPLARRFGPLLTARGATEMPSERAAAIAGKLPPSFLADICLRLDPHRSRELIRRLSSNTIVDAALALIERRAFLTLGRLADFLEDHTIRAVMEAVEDEESLLRIAYFMESHTRLDHLVHLLPQERRIKAVLLAKDPERDLIEEIISLIANVSYELKKELGELAAAQSEEVLNRIIEKTEQRYLWADLLPVIAELSEDTQRKVLTLPALRRRPEIVAHIIRVANENQLWSSVLPLVGLMQPDLLQVVADQAAALPRDAIKRAMDAALMMEQWQALIAVAVRLPENKQREVADIIHAYGAVDPRLQARLTATAQAHGLGYLFDTSATTP